MRILVDTNVVIDVLQKREPRFADSYFVVRACAQQKVEGWLSAKAITDVFCIMHHHFHDNEPCLDAVKKLYKLFRVADTTASACLRAAFSLVGDFEDALVDETARMIGADYIVTRNIGDFKNSTVPAITPSDLKGLVG